MLFEFGGLLPGPVRWVLGCVSWVSGTVSLVSDGSLDLFSWGTGVYTNKRSGNWSTLSQRKSWHTRATLSAFGPRYVGIDDRAHWSCEEHAMREVLL